MSLASATGRLAAAIGHSTASPPPQGSLSWHGVRPEQAPYPKCLRQNYFLLHGDPTQRVLLPLVLPATLLWWILRLRQTILLPSTAHTPTLKTNCNALADSTCKNTAFPPTRGVINGARPKTVALHFFHVESQLESGKGFHVPYLHYSWCC